VTLDFVTSQDVRTQHYAFPGRRQGVRYRPRPAPEGRRRLANHEKTGPNDINRNWGGRGFYFEDPNGHWVELIAKPYGDL
jgi:hypothetical protein